jgi:hypothetical protein
MNDKPTVTDGVTMDSRDLAARAIDAGVPLHCTIPLAEYLTGENKNPGHFLTAVLKNDLHGAVSRADDENQKSLHKYIQFLHMYAPYGAFGSEEKFNAWIRKPE